MRKCDFHSLVMYRFGTKHQGIFELVFCILVSSASIVRAECTPTPDCASIGYTETLCEGKFVRCPFDTSKLFCIPCDNDYKYTCAGNNVIGGVGNTCGGKYASCECITGASFINGECICDTSCVVGNIYYSDKTCSSCVDNSKTSIGVVVKDNELIMNLDEKYQTWSSGCIDIPNLNNYSDSASAIADYNGKNNTTTIITAFPYDTTSNNAAIYCNNYSTVGTSTGEWYLPAFGELYNYVYFNQSILKETIENKLHAFYTVCLWSSTKRDLYSVWVICPIHNSLYFDDSRYQNSIRCMRTIN